MKTGYTVADAMTTKPVTVRDDLTVRDASKVMRDHDVGSLLVVDKAGLLVGIMIAEDIVHRVTAEAKPSSETLLKEVMTTDVVDTVPETDLNDAMALMKEHDVMHLPVRDAQKKLVGILTMKDILRIEPELMSILEEKAEIGAEATSGSGSEGYCENCGNYSEGLRVKHHKRVCAFCYEEA